MALSPSPQEQALTAGRQAQILRALAPGPDLRHDPRQKIIHRGNAALGVMTIVTDCALRLVDGLQEMGRFAHPTAPCC